MTVSSERDDTAVHRSIGEVLALLRDEFPDITISKIRFLESQGLVDPERTPSGYRRFYDKDLERLRFILRQQRENYLPLKVIKDRLDVEADSVSSDHDRGADAPPSPVAHEFALAPPYETPPTPTPASAAVRDTAPVAPAAPRVLREPALFAGRPASTPPASPAPVAAPAPTPQPVPAAPAFSTPTVDTTSVSLTASELADATGLRPADIAELERFGLISARSAGNVAVYDDEALVVARLAAAFRAHGFEARHLRMFKVAADREAAMFEQIILPLVRQRTPEARRILNDTLTDLARLTDSLHAVLLASSMRALG